MPPDLSFTPGMRNLSEPPRRSLEGTSAHPKPTVMLNSFSASGRATSRATDPDGRAWTLKRVQGDGEGSERILKTTDDDAQATHSGLSRVRHPIHRHAELVSASKRAANRATDADGRASTSKQAPGTTARRRPQHLAQINRPRAPNSSRPSNPANPRHPIPTLALLA
jgi:hypothetical protein